MSTVALQLQGCAAGTTPPPSISSPNRIGGKDSVVRSSRGAEIDITRRDGTVLRGRYLGTERMAAAEYERHWAAMSADSARALDSLPALGAKVAVRAKRDRVHHGRLEGFGYRDLEVRDSSGAVRVVPFEIVVSLEGDRGEHWTRNELIAAAVDGHLPMFTQVRLGVGSGEVTVPADQVAKATGPDGTSVMLVVGVSLLVAAVATVAVLAAWFSSWQWRL